MIFEANEPQSNTAATPTSTEESVIARATSSLINQSSKLAFQNRLETFDIGMWPIVDESYCCTPIQAALLGWSCVASGILYCSSCSSSLQLATSESI